MSTQAEKGSYLQVETINKPTMITTINKPTMITTTTNQQ
jgi:hypothetical protein